LPMTSRIPSMLHLTSIDFLVESWWMNTALLLLLI